MQSARISYLPGLFFKASISPLPFKIHHIDLIPGWGEFAGKHFNKQNSRKEEIL
jgi:hypothetical protein